MVTDIIADEFVEEDDEVQEAVELAVRLTRIIRRPTVVEQRPVAEPAPCGA